MKNPVAVNGVYTVKLEHGFVFEYCTKKNVMKIFKKDFVLKRLCALTTLTPTLFNALLEDAKKEVIAYMLLMKKAALIVRYGPEWMLLKTGSFDVCKGEEKRIRYAYKETKVIYEINLSKYGINI